MDNQWINQTEYFVKFAETKTEAKNFSFLVKNVRRKTESMLIN